MSLADKMHGHGSGFQFAHVDAMTGEGVVAGGGCGDGGEACCSMTEGTGTGVGGGLVQGYLVLAIRLVNRVEREW
jgi:hypothetical protein